MVLLVALLCIGWMPVMADAPTPWQMGFQDPATAAMEGIVDLHHDICFFLVTILVLVLWLGIPLDLTSMMNVSLIFIETTLFVSLLKKFRCLFSPS